MIDVRFWRLSLALIPLALVILMFSLQEPPAPRQAGIAPDAFDSARATALTRELASSSSSPTPGSAADDQLAALVTARFGAIEGAQVSEQTFDSKFEGEDVELRNVIAVLPGESERQVALIAARDVPEGSGAASSIASTAALLEIANSFAGSTHRKTLVFVSTDGGSLGALGARRFARDYTGAPLLDSVVALSQPAARDPRPPLVVPWSTGPESTSAQLAESATAAVEGETGRPAGNEGPLEELFRLAIPSGLGEQAPLVAAGLDAVRISSSGELPPPPVEDGPEAVNEESMGRFGRATLALMLALDASPELEHGPATYLGVGGNLLPGWTLGLLALAILFPVALAAAGGLGRTASTPEQATRSLAWALGRVLPLVAVLMLAYVLSLVGLLPSPEFPFDPRDLPPGTTGIISLLVLLAALVAALYVSRPLRPPPARVASVAAPAALLVACVATLAIWIDNPFLALLVAPGLYLWLPVASSRSDLHPVACALLLVVGTLPLFAAIADLADRFQAGPAVLWDLLEMVLDGQISFAVTLSLCALGGSALALVAARRPPIPAAPRMTVSGPAQSRRWSNPPGSSSRPEESRSETPEPAQTSPITVRRQPADWSEPPASETRSGGRQARSS